jgi:TolB-like protein/DNA-binding winged helix-turn-helix (wHTH) protein/Tfp pilus assembly protein PilF
MERPPTQSPLLKFGVFEVDLASGELRKSGMRQNLSGQPFEVLRILLEHPQELVTREELRRHLWPDNTFVDYDLALKRVINRLRDALGDSANNPRFIETIPRKGYRFIAPLSENGVERKFAESPPEDAVGEASQSRRQLRFALSVAVVIILLVLAFAVSRWGGGRSTTGSVSQIHSLVVLPLQNLSSDPAQEYFSDGMTDALITDLAQIGSVKVISRTSSMQYKQTKKSLPEIVHELNVDGIIEGTVQRSGDRVRITAQLIYGPTDKHLWARSYEEELRDIFTLERDIAGDIAQQVQSQLTVKKPGQRQPRPVDPKVLDAYIQGSYFLNSSGRGAGDEERKKARKYFQQAIDLDPSFAPAYVGLAQSHELLMQGAPEDLVIVKRAAEKALELDPTSSDAGMELALIKWELWDWSGVEEDCRRALALNPNNVAAHDMLASVLDVTGRLDEGLREYQIAQELDPNHDHLADALYQRGQFEKAIEIRERLAKADPADGYNHFALALAYAQKGLYKRYVEEMSAMAPLFGLPELGAHLQQAYAKSGYQGALRQWAKELEYFAAHKQAYYPGALAQAYTTLGDKDRAFYWLEQYSQHRDLASADPTIYFKTDPWFAPLRSDPRFSDYLRRIGLQPSVASP